MPKKKHTNKFEKVLHVNSIMFTFKKYRIDIEMHR